MDWAMEQVSECLSRVYAEMQEQTRRFAREMCANGDCSVSPAGVHYVTEDRIDAFGHCYMGCRGTQRCGAEETEFWGENREIVVETASIMTLGLVDHNSFDEDLFNQRLGRQLALRSPGTDSYQLCYRAVLLGSVKLHNQTGSGRAGFMRVYNCADITIEGRHYPAGLEVLPAEYISRVIP